MQLMYPLMPSGGAAASERGSEYMPTPPNHSLQYNFLGSNLGDTGPTQTTGAIS